MIRRFIVFLVAVLAMLGIAATAVTVPAQAMSEGRISTAPAVLKTSYGTYSNCVNGASYYARIGVYWGVNGFVVRPNQVWFQNAAAGIYKMEVKYWISGSVHASHTFPQSGQIVQYHNWTGLDWGGRSYTTYVWFRLTLKNGNRCTGVVRAVA
jgi:hypothetical protein